MAARCTFASRVARRLAHASPKGLFDTPSVGDCFAYALAKERDLPLLFKGADFAQTDVTPALS